MPGNPTAALQAISRLPALRNNKLIPKNGKISEYESPVPSKSIATTGLIGALYGSSDKQDVQNLIRKRYSYSGHDMVCSIVMPMPDGSGSITKVVGELQHLTYSIHEEKTPVRNVGNMNARGYVFGPRTIAGSLVFGVFYRHFALEIMHEYLEKQGTNAHFLMGELPEFDLIISCANEYGDKSVLVIYGITLVNEGQVMSINDIYTENTYEYYAKDIDYLTEVTNKSSNSKKENKKSAPTVINDKEEENNKKDFGAFLTDSTEKKDTDDKLEETEKPDNEDKPDETEKPDGDNSDTDDNPDDENSDDTDETEKPTDSVKPYTFFDFIDDLKEGTLGESLENSINIAKNLFDKAKDFVNNTFPEQADMINNETEYVKNKINELSDQYENEKAYIENEMELNHIINSEGNKLLEELKNDYESKKDTLINDYNDYKNKILEECNQKFNSYYNQLNDTIKQGEQYINSMLESGYSIAQDKADEIKTQISDGYNNEKEYLQNQYNEFLDSIKIYNGDEKIC